MSGAAAKIFRPVVASWNWLRMAWATQPVLFVSGAMAIAGEPTNAVLSLHPTSECRDDL